MKVVSNRGSDRLIDAVRPSLQPGGGMDLTSPTFSVYAFEELRDELAKLKGARLLLPSVGADLHLLGGEHDRAARNRLSSRYLAASCAEWLARRAEVRHAPSYSIPQGVLVTRAASGEVISLAQGSFGFDRAGLGLTPGNPYTSILRSENESEATALAPALFEAMWESTLTLLKQARYWSRCAPSGATATRSASTTSCSTTCSALLAGSWMRTRSSTRRPASATP